MNKKLTGVLLINLGTPDNPSISAVRKYLTEFLSDPRVIELPSIIRTLLVRGFIIPFRIKKVTKAYQSIWLQDGSPLLVNSLLLGEALQQELGDNYKVVVGMRYGNPSIFNALQQLKSLMIDELIVVPLFPHYASAVTGSALQKVMQIIAKQKVIGSLKIIDHFFQNPNYIKALADSVAPYMQEPFDYFLMSYHGLPERQLINPGVNCYKTQCIRTSQLLARELALDPQQWSYSFQSRLGKIPWIKPYTEEVLKDLHQRGVRKLLICCPSFISDCLETLEEIAIRAKEQWLDLGGESLQMIPCLNAQPQWATALSSIVLQK